MTWRVLLVICFISGLLVYATTIDRTVYTTEQLIVIPGTVTSDSWEGLETVLVQDLSGDALYQNFSPQNSAHFDPSAAVEEEAASSSDDENFDSDTSPDVSGGEGGDTSVPVEEPGDVSNEEEVVEEPAEPAEPAEPTEETAPPDNDPPAEEESLPTESQPSAMSVPVSFATAVTTTTTKYPWAQFSEVTPLPEESVDPAQENVDPVTEEPLIEEEAAQGEDDSEAESETTAEEGEGLDPQETPSGEVVLEGDELGDLDLTATTTASTTRSDEYELFGRTPCALIAGCEAKSLTFTGFGLPEFAPGTVLDTVQLRLSLAAKANEESEVQRFVILYSYDEIAWQVGSVIDVEGEAANSINGDHYLVSLNAPNRPNELAKLSVRVVYEGVMEELQNAYVDAVWLEVTAGSFYEEGDMASSTDAIDYVRDLEAPEMNTLMSPDMDVRLGQAPEFTFEYQRQQNIFKRMWRGLFGENTFSIKTIDISSSEYGRLETPFEVVYHDDTTWTLKLPNSPYKMQPGKYSVVITINENDEVYTDEFEFYWGVLAVNTTKSMYNPNEDVTFNMAALTEEGDTICDARLFLKVVSPSNVITEVPVEQSGSCGVNNVTDVPDYLATFKDTAEVGEYQIQLEHRNISGVVVHKIHDSFSVLDFIPYDIERTAPTRIYPLSMYGVNLHITANRSFEGDIIERVPRGFLVEDLREDALVTVWPDYTEIKWPNVTLEEGDEIDLSYRFDAPDLSPYMYMLGPLDMDGFKELREWQIASDALSGVGWFTGTRSVADTNLNAAPSPMQWSTSSIDTYYFNHSTSSSNHQVTLRQDGDYFVAVTLPQQFASGANQSRVGVEVRINGVTVPQGVGRSGFIANANNHSESSSHTNFLLTDINANDTLEVYVEGLTTIGTQVINVTGQAGMYIEYMPATETVFSATTTRTVASTSLNTTASALEWTETRQDSGYVHSDSVNPENITISNPGVYMVQIAVPLTGTIAEQSVQGRVLLDGALVSGGIFTQGYQQNTLSDTDSSIHWSGIVVATTTNQVLTITTQQEAAGGIVTVTSGLAGSVFIQRLPATEVFAARGRDLVSGTDWNPAASTSVRFDVQLATSTTFTHSTSTNNHQVTVNEAGDYLLTFNDAVTVAGTRNNNRIVIYVNGVAVTGAQTKSNFIRNATGHTEGSAALTYLLTGLSTSSVVTVTTQREANTSTVNDSTDAVLMMWKKIDFNARPGEPTTYNTPFNNIRFASTTPYFTFSTTDPDGTSDLQYEFQIGTSSDFSGAITRTSGVDSGFTNTASSTDTSPYLEGNTIQFQLQSADALTDITTYYWRARARDVTGSNNYGDWTTTQSLTVDMAASAPNWYQSFTGQFSGNTLIGTISSGDDRVEVDAQPSAEILVAYGEGAVTTPRYRLWNGSNWGVEQNAIAVPGVINWVETAAAVSRDEYVMATLDASSTAYAQVYQASSSSWGNQTLLATGITSPSSRGVAVAYESVSGDAIAVSCANGPDPVYRVWNGSSWSATSTLDLTSLNNCNFIRLASDPGSDEIIAVVRDTGTTYEAIVWDGTAWSDGKNLGTAPTGVAEGMALSYEASGEQAVVAVANGTAASFLYTIWDGEGWSSNSSQTIGNDLYFANMVPDADSDEMLFCYVDADADISILRWDGGAWSNYTPEIETADGSISELAVDCEFETTAGRSAYGMITFTDTTNMRYRTATSTTWSTEASMATVEDGFWVATERAGDGTIVSITLDDTVDDLISTHWNGSSWSSNDIIETNPSSILAAPYQMFDMSAKRFQFTQGVVRSQPINFSFVPGQPEWGDVSFSATEPFGTEVLVRLRYTASTTCDTLISDGALAGNSSGFDMSELPIDISGLSTTTYSQICLEATVTTLGSASASLDDWNLAWVREPKYIQSSYRWYTNLSSLTPADPWPAGVTDLAESTAMNSAGSININDVVRLRLGLEGANVTLPTSTDMLKLQFAPGLVCSPSLSWSDVATTSSSTAIWRGFENSIVGSDWYASSSPRRVSVSIRNNMVTTGNDLVNFPVYVNLADLPATFFSYVQSDGDDIRVTTGDGVTEVPYELVSINTVAKTGELHFKAPTLSTTTNTTFYIYYGNGSASGYSVGSTYGRNNVWSNGFVMVYHLDQSPTSSSPQYVDSTGNSNGIATNMEGTDRRNGIVGRYADIDGTNEYIDLGSTLSLSILNSTWMVWASTTAVQGAYDGLLMTRAPAETTGINVSATTNRLGYHWRDAANTYSWAGAPIYSTTSAPFMATLTVQPTVAVMFHNSGLGMVSATNTVTHATATLNAFDIGQDPFGTRLWQGGIDEASISNVIRSNGWISTTYNNKSNPTGFYTVSAEEMIGDGRMLPSALLSATDRLETYEENNPTSLNRNALPVGEQAEWDFALQNNGAAANTNYCFRLVYSDGSALSAYDVYPRLITNAPPLAPELTAPFDNEQLASSTPWFEFSVEDELGDDVSYEIEIDDDYSFASPVTDRESNANFSEFENLVTPAERSIYTSGQTVRFIPPSSLSNGVTYYWRVRAKDDNGSGAQGPWSTVYSFRLDTGTLITTWFQTEGEQFATNEVADTLVNLTADDVRIETSLVAGTTTSTVIDFDDRDTGNAWGTLAFNNNVSSGAIRYYVYYRTSGENFALVPDTFLSGNSSGFTSSPISLAGLDPAIHNELKIAAALTGNDSLPRLQDWTVTWGLTIEEPLVVQPFDNAKVSTTSPAFSFYTSDPQAQDLQYEVQLSSSYDFTSSSTFTSGVSAGFANTENGGDTSPFISGDIIRYTIQTPLSNGQTYWWRVRAKDPGGSDAWSNYSDPTSFTVDTGITVSTWYQTTGEQFATNDLSDIETTSGNAQITSIVREVMIAYALGTNQAPVYRVFDGSVWNTAASALSVGAQIRWTELKAATTRSEYALATIGTDNDANVQIYNGGSETWGDLFTLEPNINNNAKGGTDVAYETDSGDLVAVACSGVDAVYSIWNGTSWSATSSINLTNTANCDWVQMASDPDSDEIIAVFRHTNTNVTDFEAFVWNGSSWGNNVAFADMQTDTNEGMALEYEESGDQAVLVLSNNTAASVQWRAWNGSAWNTATTTGAGIIGDHMEWGSLRRDVGSDTMMLCYVDNDNNVGVMPWTGSTFTTATEIEAASNGNTGQAIDCAFETTTGRDGYRLAVYSDNSGTANEGGRYQISTSTAWSGELDLGTVDDSWKVSVTRAGDGIVHAAFFDDARNRFDLVYWDGTSWSTQTSISGTGWTTPFNGVMSMAARTYPDFTEGQIVSTPIEFSDGSGPRWERFSWSDTTSGSSDIRYHLYYQASSSNYILVPDSALPGNSTGFTTSPVSIATLDRTIYSNLKLVADFSCVSGICPTLQDWSVEWSEGINVSGRAYEYDGIATTSTGTLAVVVDGELLVGKTGVIAPDGTWSISNVTAFEGQTVMVFVNGASSSDEAIAISTYDGVSDMTDMELIKRHVTIGSSDNVTTTNLTAYGYDHTDDEDIFIDIGTNGSFDLCIEGCADTRLKVKRGSVYQPQANLTTHDLWNFGTLILGTTTVRVRGSWDAQGTTTEDTSTVIMSATSTAETITASGTSATFYNLTLGETSGTATWSNNRPLDVNGTLAVDYGTLARSTTSLSIARDFRIGAAGLMTGLGTTTFDGSGSFTWQDSTASSTNIGNVVIDGTAKTITLASNVMAESVTIGSDDTLNASGSGFNISIWRNWTNNNAFIPQTGTVTFVGTTTGTIMRGVSSFNNLTFSGVGGVWSFSTSTLALTGNFTIATGTVTLPTGTTTIGGSFLNTGGAFAHNNGEVRMTSNSAGRSITTRAGAFNNAFYNLSFTGSGGWTFTDAATTSLDMRITAGTVTLASTTTTVGGEFIVSGSGSFAHNNGELILLVRGYNNLQTNGSSINNLRLGGGSGSWYNLNWSNRVMVTVQSSQVQENVTNFPVYVDLASLPASFFSTVAGDGRDIRVTTSDGTTEVPYELVRIATTTSVGELHFKAPSLSSSANTSFYIYYGNSLATAYTATSTYGRTNVWSNGYTSVFHLDESPTASAPQFVDSATTTTTGTAFNLEAGDQQVGQMGRGIVFDGVDEYIQTSYNHTLSTSTWSAWIRPTGIQNAYDGIVFSRGAVTTGIGANSAGTGLGYHWNDTAATYGWLGAPNLIPDTWHRASLTVLPATATMYRHATSTASSSGTNVTAHGNSLINDLKFGQDDAGGRFYAGFIDEVRISNVVRTSGWLDTEFNNQSSSTAFYAVSGVESAFYRIFNETNTTILGNYISEARGDARFPSGVLSIGGSFDNNATFNSYNGTVRFNSSSGAETIAVGSSTFSTLEFNSAGGDFTITENATATVAINLTTVNQFTLASSTTLATQGTFTNAANGANTTWTGSTLRLLGSDGAMNLKSHGGDTYNVLALDNDVDMNMWNSSATTILTASTSSLYSQDHAAVDGSLYIYGDYARTSGTEYWKYDTDFDGAALGTSTRIANVRLASSTNVTLSNATLDMRGALGASTTVAGISGRYFLTLSSSTLLAQYFTITDTTSAGLSLLNGTYVPTLANGRFTISTAGGTGMTVATTTIAMTPATQYFNIDFATSTAITATNVTTSGTSPSFWWFRQGLGNLYGEAFDNDGGNPGMIQWDDSSFSVIVSGTVYADDGVTPLTSTVCDGISAVVTIVVDNTVATTTPCSPIDGTYRASGISFTGDPSITAYINRNNYAAATSGIALRNQQTGTAAPTAGGYFTLTRPTVQNGDLLVAIVGKDDYFTVTPPPGWYSGSELGINSNDVIYTGMWYRPVMKASDEPSSYHFVSNDSSAEDLSYFIASFSGVDLASPFDVTPTTTKLVNPGTSASAPTLTTTVNGSYVLAMWYTDNDNAITMPGGSWTSLATNIVSADNNNLSVAGRLMATAGATGAATITNVTNTRDPHVAQFALRRATRATTTDSRIAATVTRTPILNSSQYNPSPITLVDSLRETGTAAITGPITVRRPMVSDGDVLIAFIGKDDDPTITPPSGWTAINTLGTTGVGDDIYTGAWYKVATSGNSEPSTYTFTSTDGSTEGYSYWIGSFRGVDPIAPIDVSATWANNVNSATPAAASVTTVTANTYVLAAWWARGDNDVTLPGGSWTTLIEDIYTEGGLSIASRRYATAGATGAASLSGVTGTVETHAIQIPLRPAGYGVPDRLSNFDLYAGRTIVRSESSNPIRITDMIDYDSSDDSDIPFTALSGPDRLTSSLGSGLWVWASSTFTPGGNITLTGNASSASAVEGTLTLATSSTFVAQGTETHTLAGRLVLGTSALLTPASSTFVMNATTTGKSITSVGTINLNNLTFSGTGGAWNIGANLAIAGNMTVSSGTVTGTGNITVSNGSVSGNGTLSLGGGTLTLQRSNTWGGTTAWTVNNLTLGDGGTVGTTTPAGSATTTVSGLLTVSNAHFLDAGAARFDLTGSSTVMTVSGTFIPGTSLVRYSGTNANVLGTSYYDLSIGALTGSSTFTGVGSGLAVANNLTVGNGTASSTFTLVANDPVLTVGGMTQINSSSTFAASDLATSTFSGSYDNNGRFVGNNGKVLFNGVGSHTIAAGSSSSFSNVVINGTGSFTISETATATGQFILHNHSLFTLATGTTLAVGSDFFNRLGSTTTAWSGTLYLYGGGTHRINASTTNDIYNVLSVAANTKVRMWNSSAATYTTLGGVYSQDHGNSDGLLHIYGTWSETSENDYWSYGQDFDGTLLSTSTSRAVTVRFASSTVASWLGGSLTVVGSTTASTSLQNQGVGSYGLTVGGSASTTWNYVTLRDLNISGIVLGGTPTVNDFSNTDHLVQVNNGTGITVGGTVINTNEAKNFTNNRFVANGGVTGASNVTATGTSVSSWRFTNHTGALSGEANDTDPAGDPGYIVWDDSAALITVSGNVYSDEGVTVSANCDGVTNNVVLRVAGLTTYSTTCNATTGAYSIPNVAFGPLDSLVLWLDGETQKAASVTKAPISSISSFNLYESRVIVRHENTQPITIADMAVWDSSDDADIPFTAVDAGTDTLTLGADRKLIIWTGKTFAPGGNVTLSGGGGGTDVDGTLEALANARFRASGTEVHSIAGNVAFGAGAVFEAGQSTTTFTSSASGRTIDVNSGSFYNVAFTGSGAWTVTDTTFATYRHFAQSAGTLTFGSGTTTINGSFHATGGAFTMSGPALLLTSTTTGNVVRFDDATVPTLRFTGSGGSWSMTDTNATTSGGVYVDAGTVSLPSGNFALAGSFEVATSGVVTHNTSDLIMTSATAITLRANNSDLFALRKTGVGTLTILDGSVTFRDDVVVATGTLIAATNTLAIGGSFNTASGTFTHNSGTVLFNATASGKTISLGNNALYNANFGSASGGWTWSGNATTTNNLTLSAATSFTKDPNTTLVVGGVFTNAVGGSATTWATSTLRLTGASAYTINTKSTGGDVYGTLAVTNADIRMWNSSAATTTTGTTASIYSQDHAAVDGTLNIYGDFTISTTSEYWSYATDFDGTTLLGGARRAVNVRLDQSATTTVDTGTLNIVGDVGATTTISNIATGTYAMVVTGGSFNANYYHFNNLSGRGLTFSGAPSIVSLDDGYFNLAVSGGSLITVASTSLDANASDIYDNIGFRATGPLTGYNVELVGSTSNAWRFTNGYGNLSGESFDIDGIDACGALRFDNSACLLTSQTHFRWRADDGGEGAPNSEWYDSSWDYRQRVRIDNTTATAYSTTSIKLTVPYDASMQTDFDDLRFTLSNGTTLTSHWIERYTASTEATVWVRVPSMAANSFTTVFMYYGNATTSSNSSATATMAMVDDFEDNNISEYSGDVSLFMTDTTPTYGNTYALESFNKSGRTTDGIFRNDVSVSQGQILRFMKYIDSTTGTNDEACTLFGVQSPGTTNNNYAVCIEQFPAVERLSLAKNVSDNDTSGGATILASTSVAYTTGWYQVEVDWRTNNQMTVYLYNPSGTIVASTTGTDSSYTTGGIGYSFWVHNGSWDSYTARGRGPINPPVYFGAEQTDGGASWIAAQDAAGNGLPGDVRRLRFAIENSGLTITGQTFRLQYAAKGAAPSCEAVSSGSFAAVPNQSSCGSSPVCMQTSSNVTDGGATTDLLQETEGTFVAGKVVESPSNITGSFDIDQNYYTELEYVITPTVNASDAYCFRVVNNATPLDFYSKVAELGLQFDPSFGPVTLNGGADIVLIPNATTTIYATGTVTDFNGYADIIAGSSTIYRSGAGAACSADTNNCYISSTGGSCSFTDCSGNTCELRCSADIYFHADPTDVTPYEGEEWLAYLEVHDMGGGYDFASAPGVELLSLRALTVNNAINYGSLEVNSNTGTYNPTTTISNIGNTPFDLDVQGTDLTDGVSSVIPADQQKFATTSFSYSSCVSCFALSTSTPVELPVNLSKPTTTAPLLSTSVYWGIAVPLGINSAAHQGINVFTPVSP